MNLITGVLMLIDLIATNRTVQWDQLPQLTGYVSATESSFPRLATPQ